MHTTGSTLAALGLAVLALAATADAQTVPRAGFDCRKAGTAVEIAICADPATAAADYAMAMAYQAQMASGADSAYLAALTRDQRAFLRQREDSFKAAPAERAAVQLRDATEMRAEVLNWMVPAIDAPGQDAFVGIWRNADATISVRLSPSGALYVESRRYNWLGSSHSVCGVSAGMERITDTLAGAGGFSSDFMLERKGTILVVPKDFCDEIGTTGAGSFKGAYFRVGQPDPAPAPAPVPATPPAKAPAQDMRI